MQAITSKPADRDVDLSFTHQLAIVNDAGEQTSEHQQYPRFWIDAGPAVIRAVSVGDLFP